MEYTDKSPLEPTEQQRQRIDEIMKLFPDIRYQIGGESPSRELFPISLISEHSILVFVHTDFFDKYYPLDIIKGASRAGHLPWLNRGNMGFSSGIGHVYIFDDDKVNAKFVRTNFGKADNPAMICKKRMV